MLSNIQRSSRYGLRHCLVKHVSFSLQFSTNGSTESKSISTPSKLFDWKKITSQITDPKVRASFDQLRKTYSSIEKDASIYCKEPKPIDFEFYKNKIKSPDLVNAMEKDYNAMVFPAIDPAQFENQNAAEFKKVVETTLELVKSSKERIVELEDTIDLMEKTRSSRETTIEELEILYPEILKEIDEEIGNYDWGKDAGP